MSERACEGLAGRGAEVDRDPASNHRETGQKAEKRPNIGRFPQNLLLFKLPSSPQQAYSVALNLPVAGTGLLTLCFLIPRRRRMAKGTVKWFNPTKGYGFIQPSTGGKDVFVHISAVQKAGLSTLNEGQTIEYEEIANRGKTSAENLKV
jgi:cold shock protein